MPAGTFKVATPIYPAAKSNFTLSGAGQGQTILHVTINNVPIYSSGVMPWPPPSTGPAITAGATKGSQQITVSDTSAFAPDMLFSIAPATPTWAHNLGGFPDTLRNMGGMFKVRSKTATTITFDPPCPFDFSGMNPDSHIASGATTIQGVGYESFTIDMSDSHGKCVVDSVCNLRGDAGFRTLNSSTLQQAESFTWQAWRVARSSLISYTNVSAQAIRTTKGWILVAMLRGVLSKITSFARRGRRPVIRGWWRPLYRECGRL